MVMPVLLEEVLVVQGLAARQCRLDIAEELAGPMLREAREALPANQISFQQVQTQEI
jgi:hypothetical protein